MPQATVAQADARSLNARDLSRLQPTFAVEGPLPDEAPDPQFMKFLGGYGALPVDLAARLMRCSPEDIEHMVVLGVGLGWMRYREFPLEQEVWILLRGGGWKQVGKEPRAPLKAGHLSHRREVIEAHLLLREEKPGWSWICEDALRQHDNTGLTIPDGILEGEGSRWAIEVERTTKLSKKLLKKLKKLCAEYDEVVYFGSPLVRKKLERLLSAGDFKKLKMRPLPSEDPSSPKWVSRRGDYDPSPRVRRVLRLINEDGILFERHLPRLLDWSPEEVAEILEELDGEGCVRRNEREDSKGWVRCSHRGAVRSETDLQPLTLPSRGELVKRLVLTEVRLDVMERWPGASWVTRRQLEKGYDSKPSGIPRGAVDWEGKRYAVIVVEAWQDPKKLIRNLERWEEEYEEVLCYRTSKMSKWLDGLVEDNELDWVEVRDLPRPPASASYRTLEDEWRTGQDSYRPVGYEVSLLWLLNTEGLISELQLPRVLGCSPEVAERLIAPLLEHGCLERKDGWFRCIGRGPKLSGTDMELALIPKGERYREQRFQLMEVRLSHGEPVSCQDWKTNRQLAQEKSEAGEKAPTNRWPNAAVRIDGQWHAVALVLKEFRRKKLVNQLSRWAKEHGSLKCYCPAEDVKPFRQFLEGRKLSSIKVLSFPTGPDGPARVRQEAFEAGLMAERERLEARDHHKFQAQKEVAEAVRTGRLKKPDRCEICNKKVPKAKLQGHHWDYSKPLDVEWLCAKCHGPQDEVRRECEARTKGPARQNPRRSKASPGPVQKAQGQLSLT